MAHGFKNLSVSTGFRKSMVSKGNREEELKSVLPTDAPLFENGQLTRSDFDAYCSNELYLLDRKLASHLALPEEDKKVFTEYPERLQSLADGIISNGKFLRLLSQKGAGFLQKAHKAAPKEMPLPRKRNKRMRTKIQN